MDQSFEIDAKAHVSQLTLSVADLDMMTRYYREIIGFELLGQSTNEARMGVGGREILRLVAEPACRICCAA